MEGLEEEKRIWVPDEAEIWKLAYVVQRQEGAGTVTVEPLEGGEPFTVKIADTHGFDASHTRDLDDAADLNNLHEGPLLHLIISRFKKDKIYTNVGGVLISVNPYKFIPNLYTLKTSGGQAAAATGAAVASPTAVASQGDASDAVVGYGPHVYSVAEGALEAMAPSVTGSIKNQSVVISGESGAGKTEASKHVMRFLINQSMKKDSHAAPNLTQLVREVSGGNSDRGSLVIHRSSLGPLVPCSETLTPPRPRTSRLTTLCPRVFLSAAGGDLRGSAVSATSSANKRRGSLIAAGATVDPVGTSTSTDIESKLMQSNVILEAFGNAKTVRNDNSSRFGKYIKLQYNEQGRMMQANTMHFLLEKSRLVSLANKERNYHVFYQLCKGGMELPYADELYLQDPTKFRLIAQGKCVTISDEVDDAADFALLDQSLQECGLTVMEEDAIWELLAALLHLGNVGIETTNIKGAEHSKVVSASEVPVALIAELLGLEEDELQKACTYHEMHNTVHGAATTIHVPLNKEQATNSIEALIKFIYSELFSWLVAKINQAHGSSRKTFPSFIGILDIFGFEIMKHNSFEQICINFANEVLQQQFNQHIFVLEQEIYASEGLDWSQISFRDNQALIDLIGKKPKGLLIICEEHVKLSFKRAPDNSALLQTYHNTHSKNEFYAKPRFKDPAFVVKHFAGDVTYQVAGFIEKNRDSLNEELKDLLQRSSKPFIICLFGKPSDRREMMPGFLPALEAEGADGEDEDEDPRFAGSSSSSLRRRKLRGGVRQSLAAENTKGTMMGSLSVSMRFREQLETLTQTLRSTQPHYIKCVKPNNVKAAGALSPHLIIQQLRYSGVLEVVRIRREAYPTRMRFSELHKVFKTLIRASLDIQPPALDQAPDEAVSLAACQRLAERFLEPDHFQIGKTKIFLRHGVMELLTRQQDAFFAGKATVIQSRWRTIRAVRAYRSTLRAVLTMSAVCRAVTAVLRFQRIRRQVAKIQAAIRAKLGILSYQRQQQAVVVLQRHCRGHVVRNHYGKHADRRNAAIKAQAAIRRFTTSRRMGRALVAARRAATHMAKVARRFTARRRFQRCVRAAVSIQSGIRAYNARRLHATLKTQDRLRKEKERRKATTMQASARRWVATRKFQRVRRAVTRVVTLQRQISATRRYNAQRRAAVALEAAMRRRLARLLATRIRAARRIQRFRRRLRAARRIQRACRAFLANSNLFKVVEQAHECAQAGDLGKLQKLLDLDAAGPGHIGVRAVRSRFARFRSLVQSACLSGSVALVSELRPSREELMEERDADGSTALHHAASTLSLELVKYVIESCLPPIEVSAEDVNRGTISVVRMNSESMITEAVRRPSDQRRPSGHGAGFGTGDDRLTKRHTQDPKKKDKVVRQGFLKKRRETDRFRKRWCVLRSESIEYYETKSSSKPSLVIPLDGALMRRVEGSDFTLEINAPVLMRNKRNKQGRLYFQADDEVSFNSWFTDLTVVCGKTEFGRAQRSQPMHFIPTAERLALLKDINRKGETALHAASSLGSSGIDIESHPASLSLQTVIWLVENGCDVNSQDYAGNTPAHHLLKVGNLAAALALVRKGTDMSIKNNEGQSALDLCTPDMVQKLASGQFNTGDFQPLLAPPDKIANCSYVSLLVEKSSMQSTEKLARPFVRLTVYKVSEHKHHVAETPQTLVEPCVTRPDYLWWGNTFHMQSPLENLSSGAVVLLELRDAGLAREASPRGAASGSSGGGGGADGEPIAWAMLDVSKQTIDTKDCLQLEMYEYPVALKKKRLTPADLFISVDVMLSRVEPDILPTYQSPKFSDPFAAPNIPAPGSAPLSPTAAGGAAAPPAPGASAAGGSGAPSTPQRKSSLVAAETTERLAQLADMLKQGLLTNDEFQNLKQQLLSNA